MKYQKIAKKLGIILRFEIFEKCQQTADLSSITMISHFWQNDHECIKIILISVPQNDTQTQRIFLVPSIFWGLNSTRF